MKIFFLIAHFFGIICGVAALWRSRTPQGAAAWVVALLTMPILSIPLFLIFGRNRFYGYIHKRQVQDQETQEKLVEFEKLFKNEVRNHFLRPLISLARKTHQLPFTSRNKVDLLVDGEETYASMIEAIESASQYILFQSYIFQGDETGQRFIDAIIKKSEEGVAVYILFDKIGTRINSRYEKQLSRENIYLGYFRSSQSLFNRFQINFRNHRKVLVIDGKTAFVGGLNIGNEYLGRSKLGYWRDTHLKVFGAGALAAQVSFLKDWNWAKGEILKVSWTPAETTDIAEVMLLHTGPADDFNAESCLFAHLNLINQAKKRIWIATPYFIPPESLTHSLILAAMRGVDVRIMLPQKTDNRILALASTVYIERLLSAGIKFFKFTPGFSHQKVLLCDEISVVGSVNLDNRSFFINFEIMGIVDEREFSSKLEKMLLEDFAKSKELLLTDFKRFTRTRKLLARVVNLLSPML